MKKIVGAWENINMGKGHMGLAAFARTEGHNVDRLPANHLLLFINRAKNKMKLLGHGGLVVGYLRLKSGRIDMDALQYIPMTFGENGLDYNAALRESLRRRLGRTSSTLEGPLNIYRRQRQAGVTAST